MREKILAMTAGRELDTLVGKHVMQLDIVDGKLPHLPKHYLPEYKRTIFTDVPLYSSKISAAWDVVEKLRPAYMIYLKCGTDSGVACEIREDGRSAIVGEFYADTAPEAICKAALLAVMDL